MLVCTSALVIVMFQDLNQGDYWFTQCLLLLLGVFHLLVKNIVTFALSLPRPAQILKSDLMTFRS